MNWGCDDNVGIAFRGFENVGKGIQRENADVFTDGNAPDSKVFQDMIKVYFITTEFAGDFGDCCNSKIFKHVINVF